MIIVFLFGFDAACIAKIGFSDSLACVHQICRADVNMFGNTKVIQRRIPSIVANMSVPHVASRILQGLF
jgi:hypothetical protein